jgi:hypothetical protein
MDQETQNKAQRARVHRAILGVPCVKTQLADSFTLDGVRYQVAPPENPQSEIRDPQSNNGGDK